MNEPLVSVIIPIYNDEKYLKRCINSVINQTYKNLQIILVYDCSNKKKKKICDDYLIIDNKRIKVIHQKNKGLSGARNTGLKNCSGEFIAFVDSDDWISLDYYEYCLKLIEDYNADVAQIDFIFFFFYTNFLFL